MSILRFVMIALSILLTAMPAWSQQSIQIDGTTPVAGPGNTIGVGQYVRIHIRYRNLSDSTYNSTNAFRVYSPDGATWAPLGQVGNVVFAAPNNTGVQVDSTGAISKSEADLAWVVRGYGCDGLGEDTVATGFVAMDPSGPIGPYFDDRVISLIIYTGGPSNIGKHICVDSSFQFPPSNTWKWARTYPPGDPSTNIPSWGGAVCFEIVSTGLPPFFTNVPAQITGEHCQPTISYNFDASDPEGDPITFRLESGPGSIDEVTGVWSCSGVAPGSYSITIGAANGAAGGDIQTVPIIITNDPPVGDAPGGSFVAIAGITVKRPVVVTDACDSFTLSLLDVSDAAGIVTLDSGNIVSFAPATEDAGHVAILVKATDQYGAADTVSLDYDVIVCGIQVGNIDCDPENGVDVSDLTRLIDFLFISHTPLCSGMQGSPDSTSAEGVKK